MEGQLPNEQQLRYIRGALMSVSQSFPNHGEADIALQVLHSLKQGPLNSSHAWFTVSIYINRAPRMSAARLPRCAHGRSSNRT
jgi:hypothetical protein